MVPLILLSIYDVSFLLKFCFFPKKLREGFPPKNMEIFNGICHQASDPLPPFDGTFHPSLPHFFSFVIESLYLYETDFTPGPSQYHSSFLNPLIIGSKLHIY